MLPQSTIQRIADEADEYARTYSGTKLIKRPYIAGAEKEAERAAGLVEALQKVRKLFPDNTYGANRIDEALTKYNQ